MPPAAAFFLFRKVMRERGHKKSGVSRAVVLFFYNKNLYYINNLYARMTNKRY